MADNSDFASDIQEAEIIGALAAMKAAKRADAETCYECGGEIPKARREALGGCDLCIACAEYQEVMARAYPR